MQTHKYNIGDDVYYIVNRECYLGKVEEITIAPNEFVVYKVRGRERNGGIDRVVERDLFRTREGFVNEASKFISEQITRLEKAIEDYKTMDDSIKCGHRNRFGTII